MNFTQTTKWTLAYNRVPPQSSQHQDREPKPKEKKLFNPASLFDSSKNWSTMVRQDLNDIRNEIMRRNKTNQMKRRLPPFSEI